MKNVSKILKTLVVMVLLTVLAFLGVKGYDYLVQQNQQKNLTGIDRDDLFSSSIRAFFFGRKNDFVDVSKKTKEALVNIICIPKTHLFEAISGSGVIVDERGIILTNAHIGQYFLLKDFTQKDFASCVIRTGDPARPSYSARLFYISPTWVSKNTKMLQSLHPTGTGENDYALLLIEKTLDMSPLPSSFPFLKINTADIMSTGKEILVAGYPAGVLGGVALDRDLFAISAVVKINQIQTFSGGTRDFLLLSPSSVAERGSSGGAVVDKNYNLVSLIVSVRDGGSGLQGELGTLTLSHINRSIFSDTKMSFLSFLKQDPNTLVTDFWNTKASGLIKQYTAAFSH